MLGTTFKTIVVSIVTAIFLTTPAGATDFWVDALRGDDANDGTSETTARRTMQAGLDLALVAGDVGLGDG